MTATMRPGEFSKLAEDYSRYRPGYSESVLSGLLGMFSTTDIDVADIGAGTGIWTRMIAKRGVRSVVAVEPNDEMRRCGARDSEDLNITWKAGSGEVTGLADRSADWLSMASSFHWVNTEKGLAEFARILRPNGRFIAIWNPRRIEANPLLVEIEEHLRSLAPEMQRVSSGRSGIADRMTDILRAAPGYDDVVYLECEHISQQTPAQYLGAWRSVNDIQVQLGPDRFAAFLDFVAEKTKGVEYIETTFWTRAWSARRAG